MRTFGVLFCYVYPSMLLSDRPLDDIQRKSAEEHTMLVEIHKKLERYFKEI